MQIIAHDNVLPRVSALPSTAHPTETFVGLEKELYFNGEPVLMYHIPAAHTDGDSLVFFRKSDVVATGDIYRTDSYPVIDLPRGGSVQGVIDGLNRVLDLAVPAHHEEGGTFIVPGHGRISDEFDVLEYRDMVTIVRDRVHGDEEDGDDARAGEGGASDRRLRPALRCGHRRLDHRHVRRGGLQERRRLALSRRQPGDVRNAHQKRGRGSSGPKPRRPTMRTSHNSAGSAGMRRSSRSTNAASPGQA